MISIFISCPSSSLRGLKIATVCLRAGVVLNNLGGALDNGPTGSGEACWEARGARKSRTGWDRCDASCRNALAAGEEWEDCMLQREIVRAAIVPE